MSNSHLSQAHIMADTEFEAAGGTVLSGMCFYRSYAREMAEANGWQGLATNSAKLTNILGGYGYRPALLSMTACVDAACSGRIHPSQVCGLPPPPFSPAVCG